MMENFQVRKRPSISLSFLATCFDKSWSKSPRNFEGGVVGLSIVVATKRSCNETTIPTVVYSAKPAANFRGKRPVELEVFSESYSSCCVSVTSKNHKRCDYGCECCMVGNDGKGVFFASPANAILREIDFLATDFLNSCYLCKKRLHGLDIFMYRGEKAFCSADCRAKHITSNEYEEEKCNSSSALKPHDCSICPCSAPPVSFAGIIAVEGPPDQIYPTLN